MKEKDALHRAILSQSPEGMSLQVCIMLQVSLQGSFYTDENSTEGGYIPAEKRKDVSKSVLIVETFDQ